MKKQFLTLLMACIIGSAAYSQKIIDEPEFGMSTFPGKISKIEFLESSTVLHFHLKSSPGTRVFLPKKSCIKDVNNGENLFVTKAEGIPLNEWYIIPDAGEIEYKLFFPKLNETVKKIDFAEINNGGSWFIYDIVVKAEEIESLLPKSLIGNWLKTDGSNTWDYGLYAENAIVNKKVWNYKSVNKKKKAYTITLENNGEEKIIFAKISKNGSVHIGNSTNDLISYNTKKTFNPRYKITNDLPYLASSIFKIDSATYSGVLKGFTSRTINKTGMVNVSNMLTNKREAYLMKISDDGSFSVKFPLTYPQTLYVKLPYGSVSVFVEPGKETWQLINSSGKAPLFMGECAQVNSNLTAAKSISYFNYEEIMNTILNMSSLDYKTYCLDIIDRELKALEELKNTQFLGQKAVQIKETSIQYSSFVKMLSYERYRETAMRKKQVKNLKIEELDASYFDFITESVLTNETAVLSSEYTIFLNALKYAKIFRPENSQPPTTAEYAEILVKEGVELTNEELEMIEASKEVQNAEFLKKKLDFETKYNGEMRNFLSAHMKAFRKIKKKSTSLKEAVLNLAEFLKEQESVLTSQEEKLILSVKTFKSGDQLKKETYFNEKYSIALKEFNDKHQTFLNNYRREKFFNYGASKMQEVFGVSESFAFDVLMAQYKSEKLSDFTPYTDEELQKAQKLIKNTFIANSLAVENEKTKDKIEKNKTKTGFVVHQVVKTEGDELFDSMIAKFKGKVVYVDFWATWCAPCRSGIEKIAPLKEEMKNENVVFLYITNQSSPEKTWSNMIPDIKGEHYRVSQDEWNYLASKFNINGIPHYALVSKNGEMIKPRLGHNNNDALKKILEPYINLTEGIEIK